MQGRAHRRQDFCVSRQPSSPDHAASQVTFIRLHNIHAAFPQFPDIFLRRRMIPHIHVHRRSHHHRSRRRQIQSTQKIIRNSAREFSNNVGGSGRYQQQICTLRHRNMLDGAFQVRFILSIAKQVGNYFLPAQSREGQRRNKFPRPPRHHHFHGKSILLQQAQQFRSFVSRHSPGHTHRDSHGVPPRYLRRLLPSLSSSIESGSTKSYSSKLWSSSSTAIRVAFCVRGFSTSGGAPAIICLARRAASTT